MLKYLAASCPAWGRGLGVHDLISTSQWSSEVAVLFGDSHFCWPGRGKPTIGSSLAQSPQCCCPQGEKNTVHSDIAWEEGEPLAHGCQNLPLPVEALGQDAVFSAP